MRRLLLAGFAVLALGCANAGEDRILSVSGTGIFKGVAYFDLDGNISPGVGDDSVQNITVRLVTLNGADTVVAATSAISGIFRSATVPVGTYRVVVDTTPLADTARVVDQDSLLVTILPGDSVFVSVGISYPHVSIRAAKTPALHPIGRKVWVEGIVLNHPFNFRDTTMHVQDTSAAIRTQRVLATSAVAADTVRMRGTISTRSGQRILDIVTVFRLGASFLPLAPVLSTATASTADGGNLDAQQVQVLSVTITDTLPVGPDFRLTVNDSAGTGALEVLLDAAAVPLPSPRPPSFLFIPGNKFDIVGILVPTGTPGLWRLKPRSSFELVKK